MTDTAFLIQSSLDFFFFFTSILMFKEKKRRIFGQDDTLKCIGGSLIVFVFSVKTLRQYCREYFLFISMYSVILKMF